MSRGLYRTLLIIFTILCIIGGTAFHVSRLFFRAVSHLIPFADRLEEEIENSDWFDWDDDSFITIGVNGSGEQVQEVWNEDYSDCKKLDLDIIAANVNIVEGEEFSVKYDGDENLKPEVSLEDDTLKIRQSTAEGLQWNLDGPTSKITVTVPEDQLEELKLEADAGDIDISDLTLDSLDIEANAGEIDLNDITTDDLKLDADAGDINLTDVKADKLTIEVDAGDIELSNVDIRKGEASLSMGNFDYDGGTFKTLSVTVNMGDLHINTDSSLSDYSVDLSCDMGEVRYNGKHEGTSYDHEGEEGKLDAKCNMGEVEVSGN